MLQLLCVYIMAYNLLFVWDSWVREWLDCSFFSLRSGSFLCVCMFCTVLKGFVLSSFTLQIKLVKLYLFSSSVPHYNVFPHLFIIPFTKYHILRTTHIWALLKFFIAPYITKSLLRVQASQFNYPFALGNYPSDFQFGTALKK